MCLVCRASVVAKVEFLHVLCCHCHWALLHGAHSLGKGVVGTGDTHLSLLKAQGSICGTREEAGSTGHQQHKLHPAGNRYLPFGPHLLVLL